jgi:YHS domain-containing protein
MTSNRDVIDPVCGMTISMSQAPFNRLHGNSTYYFCSAECTFKFEADADAYVAVARLNLPGWGETPHPPAIVEQFLHGPDQV